MAIEDKIMDWMKNLGNLVIPGEGGQKLDLSDSGSTPRVLPPSLIKSTTAIETSDQMGGEFKMDEGMIDVITNKMEVVEFDKDMTKVTNILGEDTLEAAGETSSGGIIDSFINKLYNSETNAAEIELQGQTTDGKKYNFTLLTKPGEDGEPKFFLYSGDHKAELEMDQFVTIANNIDEKLASVENVRQSQDKWSPASFRYAWKQKPKITVGTPYPSLGNRLNNK